MRLRRTSLAFIMAVASVIEIGLITASAAVVFWKVNQIESAIDDQHAADRMQESALAMETHLREEGSVVWRALLAGEARGRADLIGAAKGFRDDLRQYAQAANSGERRALAGDIEALHDEYATLGLALLDRGTIGSFAPGDVSARQRFLALQERLDRDVYLETERLRASDVRIAQERMRALVSGMVTVLALAGIGLVLSLGIGFLALRRYTQRAVHGFMQAIDALDSHDVAYRPDWAGAEDFQPIAARFSEIQQRLEATTATKAQLEHQEATIRAANAALNTEIAARAETLRSVEHAAHAWRQTFDAVDFVLLTVDRRGTVQRVNRAALTLLGGRFDEWIGRPLAQFPDKQPWTALNAIVKDMFSDGLARTGQVEDGRVWELACTGSAAEDEFSVVWARDVTPTAELQRAVVRSEAMGAMGELLAGVAHEVRNPLFAITALLDAWSLKPEIQEGPFLEMLRHEVMRMRQLMEELLEYGRPFNPSLVVGDLKAVADEAVQILSSGARARDVTIRAAVSGLVYMDQARMLRVFLNLIQNAIDHSPAGGAIDVESTSDPDGDSGMLQILVRDHGPGFLPADLPRVFNPFFTRRPGGTGLGLPIVQRIVDEHGGRVSAGNHPDGGALLRVQLPLAAAVAPA